MEDTHGGERFGAIALAGAGFLALVLAGLLIAWGMYRVALASSGRPDGRPAIFASPGRGPAGPPIQTDPHADLAALRAREDSLLTAYGWVDGDSGFVRIPVARAMKILVSRGLPVRGDRETGGGR